MLKFYRFISLFIPAALIISILFISCRENSTSNDDLSTVAGTIIDQDQTPVSDAVVEAFNSSGIANVISQDTTDENGSYILSGLPDDYSNIHVRVLHDDFLPFTIRLVDLANRIKNADNKIELLRGDSCCGLIAVNIFDEEELPINDVEVRLNDKENIVRKGFTDNNGKLIFDDVCPGEYWLRMARDGYKVIEEELVIVECDTLDFTFVMEATQENDSCCHGVIYFFVKDADNNPIKGVSVRLWFGGRKIGNLLTNADGFVKFDDNICEGEYQISYVKEGYKGAEFNFVMGCDDVKELLKTMEKLEDDPCYTAILKLRIIDAETEQWIQGARVELWLDGEFLEDLESNIEGWVIFDHLKAPAEYLIKISKEGYENKEFTFRFNECKKITETIRLIQSE